MGTSIAIAIGGARRRPTYQSRPYVPSFSANSPKLFAAISTGTFGSASPLFFGPCSPGRATWAVRRACAVAAVGGHHHAIGGLEVERLDGVEIDARLRFEVAGDFRAQDGVPAEIVAAS